MSVLQQQHSELSAGLEMLGIRLPTTDFGTHLPQGMPQAQLPSNQPMMCEAEDELPCTALPWPSSFSTCHSDQRPSRDTSIAELNHARERLAQALSSSTPTYISFPSSGSFPSAGSSPHNASAAALCAIQETQETQATHARQAGRAKQPRQADYCEHSLPTSHGQPDHRSDADAASALWTTLLVGNIPVRYNLREVVRELEELGLQSFFDFVYLQSGRKRSTNRGYCFVNFSSHMLALRGWNLLQSHVWKLHQPKSRSLQCGAALHMPQQPHLPAASVRWAQIQGYDENMRSRASALARTPAIERNVWTKPYGYAISPLSEPSEECTVKTLDTLVEL